MNHRSSLRWDDLAAFLSVARAGGLSGAARATGSSAPTLGRRMLALERALGRELFVRRTHGYDLTDEGRAMMHDLEAVEGRLERITARPAEDALPLVKVSAGTWTTLALVRHVDAITGDPPDVRLRFVASEAVLSIARREAAIGIRNRRPTEAGQAGRGIGRVEFAPYRAPGAPTRWIGVLADTPSAAWVAARRDTPLAYEVAHPRLALDLALAGAGQTLLPTFVGDAEPGLERAGGTVAELAHDRWLVVHDDDRTLPEIRRTLDRIAAIFV